MKRVLIALLFLQFFSACSNESSTDNDDLSTATNFIRFALDGKFDKAEQLMVADPVNKERLDDTRRIYERMKKEDQVNLMNASIQIHDSKELPDGSRVFFYSNSYRNKRDSLKVVPSDGRWLVDLKYTFGSIGNSNAE